MSNEMDTLYGTEQPEYQDLLVKLEQNSLLILTEKDGMGKTCLANWIVQHTTDRKIVYIQFRPRKNDFLSGFLFETKTQIQMSEFEDQFGDSTIDWLSSELERDAYLVCMDDLHHIAPSDKAGMYACQFHKKLWEQLCVLIEAVVLSQRQVSTDHPTLSTRFVLLSNNMPDVRFPNLLETFRWQGLTQRMVHEWLTDRNIDLGNSLLGQLWKRTRGSPLELWLFTFWYEHTVQAKQKCQGLLDQMRRDTSLNVLWSHIQSQLDFTERKTLQALAAFGDPIRIEILLQILNQCLGTSIDLFETDLLGYRLIQISPDGVFINPVLRAYLCDKMQDAQYREWNSALGTHLKMTEPQSPRTIYHLFQGWRINEAPKMLSKHRSTHFQMGIAEAIIEVLEEVLQSTGEQEKPWILEIMGDLFAFLVGYEQAFACYLEAEQYASESLMQARFIRKRISVLKRWHKSRAQKDAQNLFKKGQKLLCSASEQSQREVQLEHARLYGEAAKLFISEAMEWMTESLGVLIEEAMVMSKETQHNVQLHSFLTDASIKCESEKLKKIFGRAISTQKQALVIFDLKELYEDTVCVCTEFGIISANWGLHKDAISLWELGLDVSRHLAHSLHQQTRLLNNLGALFLFELSKPRKSDGRKHLNEALDTATRIEQLDVKMHILMNLATDYQDQGDLQQAKKCYEQIVRDMELVPYQRRWEAQRKLLTIAWQQGELRKAIARLEELRENSGFKSAKEQFINLHNTLALSYSQLGDFDRAYGMCRIGLEHYEALNRDDPRFKVSLLSSWAEIAIRRGDKRTAQECLNQSSQVAQQMQQVPPMTEGDLCCWQGAIYLLEDELQESDFRKALNHLMTSLTLLNSYPFERARAQSVLAELYIKREKWTDACDYLSKANRFFASPKVNAKYELARVYYLKGRWHHEQGQREKAKEKLKKAEELFSQECMEAQHDLGLTRELIESIRLSESTTPPPPLSSYHDFELHIGDPRRGHYPVRVVDSLAGEGEATFRVPFSAAELATLLARLEKGDTDATLLNDAGERLFTALFTGDVHTRYVESVGRAGDDDGLRLRLRLDPPELHALPWELLRDPEKREVLALSKRALIVRYPPVPRPAPPLVVEPPLRILVATASPAGSAPLDVEGELAAIKEAVQSLGDEVQIIPLPHATRWALRQRLIDDAPHVLHFAGHGDFDGQEGTLVLEDERRRAEQLPGTMLAKLLEGSSVRLAVLNACLSAVDATVVEDRHRQRAAMLGVGPALVDAGLGAVVGMGFSLSDASGRVFARDFYDMLARLLPVDVCVSRAREALLLEAGRDSRDWAAPVLFLRAPDGVLFARQKKQTP